MGTLHIAVIGDIVSSRTIGARRASVQRKFESLMTMLNERFKSAIRSQFTITLGDEFQGLLKEARPIPDLIWTVDSFREASVRIAFGFGTLSTPLKPTAIQMDGPAFHAARNAMEVARHDKVHGGVFRRFGEDSDQIFDGFARLLERHRSRLTDNQRKLFALLRAGVSQQAVAKEFGVTPPAVSKSAKAAGWNAYDEGERGFKAALVHLVDKGRRK